MRPLIFALLAMGCGSDLADRVDVQVQRTRVGYGDDGRGYLSTHLLPTDSDGRAVDCSAGSFEVDVTVSTDSGVSWTALTPGSVTVACTGDGAGDVAIVADNSGSTESVAAAVRAGATSMADRVLLAGGQAGLVRVSTNATVEQELTSDAAAFSTAVSSLTDSSNGWTALWDGVRMGNEILGGEIVSRLEADTYTDAEAFCAASDRLGVVVFTDGQDNNSSDEQDFDQDAFPGDGFNTTRDDLSGLHVLGQRTPIYTIGMGDEVDHDTLEELATASGARHIRIEGPDEVVDVYDQVSEYFAATHQVCSELPAAECGNVLVNVAWTFTAEDGSITTGSSSEEVEVDCPVVAPDGGRATILMTMSSPALDDLDIGVFAENTARWVSTVFDPTVLVVLDDNHHGEFVDDADYVAGLLSAAGLDVTRLDEPASGLTIDDLAPYDVVWFSNPGYPMDDFSTFEALQQWHAAGGGLVLQGDDISWSHGHAFPMGELTGLVHQSNGTRTCGVRTDNNRGGEYAIEVTEAHPMSDNLVGATWRYGDDIDHTVPREGTDVLAWATLADTPTCDVRVPVVTAF